MDNPSQSVAYQHLNVTTEGKIRRITLNRPDVHNALDPALLDELRIAFEDVAAAGTEQVRAVVLAGEGRSFCAGADINWMRNSLQFSEAENVADALRLGGTFDTINKCPVPVIGRVHGAVLGGGVGLCAVCDIVIAGEGTLFAFSEAKLGIAPAVISPYVLSKIGRGHARALFFTAERFSTERALQIGLIHIVVPIERLDEEVNRVLNEILTSAPRAIAWCKELIAEVPEMPPDEVMQRTAEINAALRMSDQGQEGLRAFLEKRKPEWAG